MTLPAGMVKVYLPSPLSVSVMVLPPASVTVREASSWPASGFTVTVTVTPAAALAGLTVTAPFSGCAAVTG